LEPKVANLENNTFSKDQTSNIFVTSNVLSNTSNTIYNRPDIFTKAETSNVFTTSNHINTNFYNKTQIDTEIKTNFILIKKSAPLYIDSLIEVSEKFYVCQNTLQMKI